MMYCATRLVPNIVTASEQHKFDDGQESRSKNIEQLDKDALIQQILTLESELHTVREKSKFIAQELDLFRQRRAIFWSDRFRNTFDAWSLLSEGFQRLKDDTAIFAGNLKGYRLQPSLSMLRVAYMSYKVKLTSKNLSGVLLAPVVEFPLKKGEMVLQILGASKELLVETSVSVTEINDDRPVVFRFPALANSDQEELTLHVFVQNIDVPVRLLEMRKYELGGFGSLSTKCFGGFMFSEESF
jgi:hypothetical protein